ncbi:MAG: hypothetical protein J0I20_17500 [Chloroflexi bacterium]|nr:hypothetical protein [Chloroflexota bacterium]OJV88229.1 MAG: hypothetical protein BGO39_08560 [Chloroflexi bacterium 54-19]
MVQKQRHYKRPAQEITGQEEADQRRARRLASDLGINTAGVQVIIYLRGQVVNLTARVNQLETDLRIAQLNTGTRLARFRQEYSEGIWEDTP